jgi:hypothetical protein
MKLQEALRIGSGNGLVTNPSPHFYKCSELSEGKRRHATTLGSFTLT